MVYKNQKGENLYLFGWLEAPAGTTGTKDFRPTSGGNNEWGMTKRDAIAKVNRERKESEKEYPTHVRLRVDPKTVRRAKTYEEFASFDRGLIMMTI